jgi:hypothetical protein
MSDALRPILKSQYHASLAMLRDAIVKCPGNVWLAAGHTNAFWQIAYHVLFYTHLYLHRDEGSFRPWGGHQPNVQHPSGLKGRRDVDSQLPPFPDPYSKEQVLEFWDLTDGMVDGAVESLDLEAADCGFWWYRMGKLEHQFVNIRHVQHHTAQLADRLRAAADLGVPWVGSR